MNRAERRDEQQSLTLDHQHKQSLACEERLRAAPLRVDRETRSHRQVRTRLHEERLAAQFDRGNVAGAPGASVTSPGPPRAVNVEMNADSPPRAFDRAEKPPFICDCSSMLADIETIAPASAWIDCSA
jgi:hypothetical protein